MFRQRRRGRDAAQRATYLEDLSIAFKRHERELEQRNWVQFPSLIRAGPVRMSHDTHVMETHHSHCQTGCCQQILITCPLDEDHPGSC